MSIWLTILGMVVVTFGARLLGMFWSIKLPAFWLRFMRFVPVAVFAALITPNLAGDRGEWAIRLLAALLCGLAAWRSGQLWLGLFVGMAVFWLLRVI
jgi:branched-subunit amino acid transport protein